MAMTSVLLSHALREKLEAWHRTYGAAAVGRAAGMSVTWIYNVLRSGSFSQRSRKAALALTEEAIIRARSGTYQRAPDEGFIRMSTEEAARVAGCGTRSIQGRIERAEHRGLRAKLGIDMQNGMYAVDETPKGNHRRWTVLVPAEFVSGTRRVPNMKHGLFSRPFVPPTAPAEQPPTQSPGEVFDSLTDASPLTQMQVPVIDAHRVVAWRPVVEAARAAITGNIPFSEAYKRLSNAVQAVPDNLW